MNLFAEFDENYPNLVFIKTMQRVTGIAVEQTEQTVTGIAVEQTEQTVTGIAIEQTVTGIAKNNNIFPKKLPFFYF